MIFTAIGAIVLVGVIAQLATAPPAQATEYIQTQISQFAEMQPNELCAKQTLNCTSCTAGCGLNCVCEYVWFNGCIACNKTAALEPIPKPGKPDKPGKS
jgi:hypothetical protein